MINQLFETLASDNGRKFKEELLSKHKDNDTLKRVVELALNPLVNFYVRKIPAYKTSGHVNDLTFSLEALGRLSRRELTGDAAREFLASLLSNSSVDDAEVIKKIIAKDLRCGVSESTANKVWKSLIPEFPYMRCCLPKHTKMEKFSWHDGVFSQLKADGMFANVNLFDDGSVSILSRSGSDFPIDQFGELVIDIQNTMQAGTQTHGEVLVERNGKVLPREVGNGLLNSVLKGGSFAANDKPVLLVWDQLPISAAVAGGEYKIPYYARYANLVEQISNAKFIKMVPTRIVHSMADAMAHYSEMLAGGFEGTIIKNRNAVWKDTTSKDQVKFKLEVDCDLEIVGFTEGNGKNADTFGAITCKSSCGQVVVNVSGFKDDERARIHKIRDELIGTIMAVKSNNLMPPTKTNDKYSLFLPRWAEFRQDKKVADDLKKIKDQFANAISA